MLGCSFAAIGLFTSALTDNTIIAFIFGAFLCFFFYTGFDLLAELPIFSKWNEIVGDAIDKATLGLSFQDGRLEIQVGSSVWYQELSYQRSEILTKVNTWLGENLVTEVSIVQHKSSIVR